MVYFQDFFTEKSIRDLYLKKKVVITNNVPEPAVQRKNTTDEQHH